MPYLEGEVLLSGNAYITIDPNFIDEEKTRSYFNTINELFSSANNRGQQLWFGHVPYTFSGIEHKINTKWNSFTRDLLRTVYESTGFHFNSALLVKFVDYDELDLHKNDEDIFDLTYPIAGIRFGAVRELSFYDISKNPIKTIDLKNGSLYTLSPEVQNCMYTSVPKPNRPATTISITFRKIKLRNPVLEVSLLESFDSTTTDINQDTTPSLNCLDGLKKVFDNAMWTPILSVVGFIGFIYLVILLVSSLGV